MNYITGPSRCEHLEKQVKSASILKALPLLYSRDDVTVCIYVRTLRTIASIFGVADWMLPSRLCPGSRAHLVIPAVAPFHLQRGMLSVRHSLRSQPAPTGVGLDSTKGRSICSQGLQSSSLQEVEALRCAQHIY